MQTSGPTGGEGPPQGYGQPGVAPQPGAAPQSGYPPPAAPGEPQSLGQLFSLILKQLLKTLPLQLVLGGAIFIGVWLLHTYLVVWPNGGFNLNSGTPFDWFLAQILALRGRVASGTAFWFVFSALGGVVVSGVIRRKGAFFSGLGQAPARISHGFAGGNAAVAAVLSGAGLGILVPAYLGNRLFAVVAVGLTFLALSEGPAGFSALVLRCVYNDGRKLLSKPPRRLAEERNDSFMTGFMLGAGLYVLLFLTPDFMLIGVGAIALIVGVVLASQAAQAAAGTTVVLLAALLVLGAARFAFADDGGIAEAGGTLIGWIQSPGAAIAVAMGLTPAMAAALGAIIGALGPELGAQFVAGIYPSLTAPYKPKPPAPTAPVAPPANPPDIEWTDPNGVNQVLVFDPASGDYVSVLTGSHIDPANVDAWKQNIADTKAQTDAWRDRNKQVEAAGQDTMSEQMAKIDAKYQAEQAKAAAETAKWQQSYKDYLAWKQKSDADFAKMYLDHAKSLGTAIDRLEMIEKGADLTLDAFAKFAGPPGKALKLAYTMTKDVGKNISQSVHSGEGLLKGAGKGLLEAGFDYVWDRAKDTPRVQRIPGFGKYTGGDYGQETLGTLEKALIQRGKDLAKEEAIREAMRDGVKSSLQSATQKYLVKDRLKKVLGLKK